MTWRDQLQEASFRGVEFHVDTISSIGGNNLVVREYPFQDKPTVFAMGAASERITFSAYVIGDDYIDRREALRRALDASGAGELVHPTAGRMSVYVASTYTIKEAPTAEGGMARFDLSFVRADARRYPTESPSTPKRLDIEAASLKEALVADAATQWTVANRPGWAAERLVARVMSSLDAVWPMIARAASTTNDWLAAATGNFQILVGGLDALVDDPRALANNIVKLFTLPQDLSQDAARALQEAFQWAFDLPSKLAQTSIYQTIQQPTVTALAVYGDADASAITATSPATASLQSALDLTDRMFSLAAVSAWCEATAQIELASYDEAMSMRAAIDAQCIGLLKALSAAPAPADVPEVSVYDALAAVHGAALADLQARSRELVRLTTYTPQSWQPVIYISYRLYGTTAYADEILAMNEHITHPLLAPPGKPLRVVRRD